MIYFLWAMVALFAFGAVFKACLIASGKPEKPVTPGILTTVILLQTAICAGALILLLTLLG